MHLFLIQFLRDLLWFTSKWADSSEESAGEYTYTEVRDARSGAFLHNKDHLPTGAIGTFIMLAVVPLIVGEAALWLLINPAIVSFGFTEISFGLGVPALLISSIVAGLSWYVLKVVYLVGIRFSERTRHWAQPRSLGELLTPDRFSLFLVSSVPAFVIAPWVMLAIILLVMYWIFSSLFG